MLIIPQQVKVRWNIKNKEHFISKGYPFTKIKDEFVVDVSDLNKGSHSVIKYICDYCTKEFSTEYKTYLTKRENSIIKKDCCKNCTSKKSEEANMFLYGVKNPNQRQEVKEKTKQTNKEKYGVEYPSQSKEIRDKINKTNIEKYGTIYPMQNKDVKEKTRQTNIIKYGGASPMHDDDVKNKVFNTLNEKYGGIGNGSKIIAKKIESTMISKYGIKNMFQDEKVREKANFSLKKSKKHKNSKQQTYIYSITGGEINYPVGRYSLDIAFPDEKIYIEYDGSGHDLPVRMGRMSEEEFSAKEKERSRVLYGKGWKELRIISFNDKLPDKIVLKEMIDKNIKKILENNFLKTIKISINNLENIKLSRVKGE